MFNLVPRPSVQPDCPRGAPPVAIPAVPPAEGPERAEAALTLARELLYAVDQFVLSTPDLDTDRFLHRVRGTAAGVVSKADAPTLRLYRDWCRGALAAFAGLQRRYLGERETEMWRLLETYSAAATLDHTADSGLNTALREAHEGLRQASRLEDIRAAREAMQEEIVRARRLVEEKSRGDRDRSATLALQVTRLESELAAVRGRAALDSLTGVLHRGAFQDSLERILSGGRGCSLAILDLDDFRTVNNTLGHMVGDRMLTTV